MIVTKGLSLRGNSCDRVLGTARLWSTLLLLGLAVVSCEALPAADADPPQKGVASKPKPDSKKENPRGVPAGPDYEFKVVTVEGKPVVGAKVSVWQVAWKQGRMSGSFGVDPKLVPPAETEDDGVAIIIFPAAIGDNPRIAMLREADARGIYSLGLRIDHPDHPVWQDYVTLKGDRRIVLADSTTIDVHAHREDGKGVVRQLYPLLPGSIYLGADWAEKGGLLTIRRVDVQKDTRSLRIVHLPDKGPILFSNVIDLTQHVGNPISLDVSLKPGVRVEGRLSETVPRPIKNGRIVAAVIVVATPRPNRDWGAAVPIAADGTFVLESCPADENLQIVALCDGWASRSPSQPEVDAYSAENAYPVSYQGPRATVVSPRLYRLKETAIHPVIPMDPTATCQVTVHDEKGAPIPGATVQFWPNQQWHNLGSNIVGAGDDFATLIRKQAASRTHQSPIESCAIKSFSATTDGRGMAIVRNLPVGGTPVGVAPPQLPFSVSRDGYRSTSNSLGDLTNIVKLEPGKTGHITVDLERR
jgi:hypothetical protein